MSKDKGTSCHTSSNHWCTALMMCLWKTGSTEANAARKAHRLQSRRFI
ncbi:hypothetical protein EGR_10885 [Echinococcus granulosus]|uniref:Uncharacterized protein n=1 Tax=Echinococcus granulosus TaxID=6210 RepID=W6UL71_ECHGR|nr:hypothetical protein EGR_10885 [Echinococcus granulosus]EUB54259.1 hypothetical protein EGR_10885 [Echinococcus granulosus]